MKRLVVPALATLVGLATALVPASAEARPRGTTAIVFVSDRDQPSEEAPDEIYLYDTQTRATSRLTNNLQNESGPRLSPDGRYLSYLDSGNSGIAICRLTRSGAGWRCLPSRTVIVDPLPFGQYAWTPDSRSIVYAAQPTGEPDRDIYVVDLTNLNPPRDLTAEAPGEPQIDDLQPTVSPDGRHIVYSGNADLRMRRIDGSHPVQLTRTPAPANEFGAEFSPDGRRLAFHSNRMAPSVPATDNFDIFVMRPRPESSTNVPVDLTSQITAPNGAPSRERYPSFAPNGKELAFWWSTGGGQNDLNTGEIYTVRANGTHPVNLTANNPTDPGVPPVGDILPDWGRIPG
jgi:Tol biopolymer transport system component